MKQPNPTFYQLRMLNRSLQVGKNTQSILTSPQNGVEEWIANLKQLGLCGDGNDDDDGGVSFASFFVEKSCHKMPRTSKKTLRF